MTECAKSPFGQFYLQYKIHKGKKNVVLPTRPVCSDVSSISHGLGKWVTEQLQPIAMAQKSYFKDSFALKALLDTLRLAPNECFWKADATAMYTNINTLPALSAISAYLCREEGVSFTHYQSQSLIDALHIVFKHNFLKFGDTYWCQKSGTGMGISLVPPWATIFFGLYEEQLLAKWDRRSDFIIGLLTTCLGHGNATHAPPEIRNFGMSSVTTCKNGTVWCGRSKTPQLPLTLWTSPSPLLVIVL